MIEPPHDPGRTVEVLFDSLFSDDSLDHSLQIGLQAVVATAAAEMAAILVVDSGELIHQYWAPDDRAASPAAENLRQLVRDPMALRDPAGALARHGIPAETVILPLEAQGTVSGAVCYVPRGGAAPRGDLLRRVVRMIAFRAAAEIDQLRGQGIQARYERWFKTLDEQLRVLDRERQKFAAMVSTSDAAVFVTDLTRTIRWTNTVLSQRSPGGAAAWVGLACHDVCGGLSGDHSSRCRECPVERSLHENLVVHREFQVARDGAAPLNFYLTALPIKGSDGRPHEAMVMIQDLSDLEILRASESRYRLLFERSALSIVMVDPATRQILLSNPTATEMTGYLPGELLTMQLEQLLSPEEWVRLEPGYRAAVTHGDLVAHDCRVRHREGWERLTAISGTQTVFDGRTVLMLEFRDMTRTREVEETLRSLEQRLRVALANSPIVLFALDPHGIYTLSEGRGLTALGLAPGQRVGQSIFDVHAGSPRIIEIARRALAGEEFMEIIELGSLVFEVSYTPVRGPDGAMQGVIGVATDVTERQRLEGQLRQVQRMESIGRLAGGVAHDFNNLLAAILGHSELMMSRLEPGHPLKRSAEEIQKAAGRGALLTRQLLSFGRKDMLSLQVLDLNHVVAGMEGMLRRLIGEDVELIVRSSPVPACVRVDQGQIEQVIMNLVVNARDAMPHGGRLTLAVEVADFDPNYVQTHAHSRVGRHVVLTASDTGVGMDAEALSHVFEPFFTTKERGKGTGLGLATVYGIAEQGGGHVTVESRPGEGATFRFCLPCAETGEAPQEADAAALQPAPRGGSETLLLAEDEDSVRSMACEVLEALGYRVLCAADGAEALTVATRHQGTIDLLITDVVMPRLGGGELAQRLTTTRPGLRVLFISGYPDDAIVRHGVLEHRSVLLQKPFAIADFVRKVREILDAPTDQGKAAA